MAGLASKVANIGFFRYMLTTGLQCWGFSMFVIMSAYDVLKNHVIDETSFFFRLLACSVGGLLWGTGMWMYKKRR
jgi:hypothetical protein